MKYNIDKAKQIQELETNKKAQDFINDAQEVNKEIVEINKTSPIKGRKRPYNFYLDELLLQEVEAFLQEHGKYKESKSSFMEDSLRYFLAKRKSEV